MRASILARLKTATADFKTVQEVGDIATVVGGANGKPKISLQNLPGAFLYFAGQSASPVQDSPGKVRQAYVNKWGVLIATRHLNDASGAKSSAQMDDLVFAIDSVFLGFTPTGGTKSMSKSSNAGRLLPLQPAHSFYVALYDAPTQFCIPGA